MGVPGLFSYLRKYNKKDDQFSTIKSELPNPGEPVHLYLDFNGAIYQVIKPEIKTEETLIIYVLEYLDQLVRIFNGHSGGGESLGDDVIIGSANPVTKLYIAIDGVPPRAKVEQQRARRFHSVCRKAKINSIETHVGNTHDKSDTNWHLDSNMITPGTIFMDKLRKAINTHLEGSVLFRDIEIIFNDWSNPGEGEHKILQHLRSNPTPVGTKTIIYGLDGDLIMLAMASRLDNLFLIREAHEYGKYAFEHAGRPYLYMDIDCLKNALINEHSQSMTTHLDQLTPVEIARFIDDYIVLMMVLGNDFMPKIPWISIKYNGHDHLLNSYFTVQNGRLADENKWLYDRDTRGFNVEMLQAIFGLLATHEQGLIESLTIDRDHAKPRIHPGVTERERQMILMDFLPLQHLEIESHINPFEPGWRGRYYKICHQMNPSGDTTRMIFDAYWKTWYWNAEYYMNECPSWDWYYPYDYPPTLADIKHYLGEFKLNQGAVVFSESAPVEPQTLLLMVLPEKSAGLMARSIETAIKEEPALMSIYFPKSYEINIPYHTRYHECTPRIPKINLRHCMAFVKKCKLSQSELERNCPGGVKRYIDCKLTF